METLSSGDEAYSDNFVDSFFPNIYLYNACVLARVVAATPVAVLSMFSNTRAANKTTDLGIEAKIDDVNSKKGSER